MIRLLGIAGSLRGKSFNRRLLEALSRSTPEGCELSVRGLEGVPVYDQDVETEEGIPPAVTTLKEALADADGLVLVSPEYNQGVPGPLKNAIDWMSRPPADIARVFRGKPVALAGASAGPNGTRAAQYAWLPTLRGLSMQPWFGGQLYLPRGGDAFTEEGELADEKMADRAREFVSGFARFVEQLKK